MVSKFVPLFSFLFVLVIKLLTLVNPFVIFICILCIEAGVNGVTDVAWKGPIEEVAKLQAIEAEGLLKDLGIKVSICC